MSGGVNKRAVNVLSKCGIYLLVPVLFARGDRLGIKHKGEKIVKIGFVRYAALLVLCILVIGCGPAPGKRYIPSASTSGVETSVPRTTSASASTPLPRTAEVASARLPIPKAIFKNQPIHYSIEDFYARIKRQDDHISLVSNCDLDILKAFIASGWAPVVLLRYDSPLQFWALVGYDDSEEEIQLTNIARAYSGTNDLKRQRIRRLPYSDFVRRWSTRWAARKCMLVAPGLAFTEAKVRSALAKNLTATHASQGTVKSR